MSFLLKWLKPQTSSRINLRPHKDVTIPRAFDRAYDDVLHALEVTLGANVNVNDRKGRVIEASFGLVNSERLRCSFDTVDETTTNVRIEALYPAGAAVPEDSRNVNALAATLTASADH